MARLGMLILTGIVVNNSIVLIDSIVLLREQGRAKVDAIAMSCSSRLNAVLMTMATTVCGMIPVAIGQGTIQGIPYASLGVTIIAMHPDMNGGARADEDRLARVIRAWDILRRSRGFRDCPEISTNLSRILAKP